jgi:hypothetical protein
VRAAYQAGRLLTRAPHDARYAPRLVGSLAHDGSPLADAQPWMPYRAISWLEHNVDRSQTVFEYGSGGGTLFLAQRAGEVHSVEHDREWYEATRTALDEAGADVDYVLAEPSPIDGPEPPYGADSFTSTESLARSYEAYVKTIDKLGDSSLDLVVVDGRARASCAKRALPKVRDGGHILLDNSDRDEYRPVFDLLAEYDRIDFEGLTPYERQLSRASAWRVRR